MSRRPRDHKDHQHDRERWRWVYGRHVVEESLRSRACRVLELWLLDEQKAALQALLKPANDAGARVRWVERRELDRVCGNPHHQGMAARIVDRPAESLEDFLKGLSPERKAKLFLLALDQIQDPQNFGAIARTAACLGVDGILYPERHSAPVSQAVLKASAGAIQRVRTFKVGNLGRALLDLKERGVWIYGAEMSGKSAWHAGFKRPMVLVVGSEGKGVRPLVRSYCDELVSVPMSGGVASLNASAAAAILLYEAVRQTR